MALLLIYMKKTLDSHYNYFKLKDIFYEKSLTLHFCRTIKL
jgi:hypothetical protein